MSIAPRHRRWPAPGRSRRGPGRHRWKRSNTRSRSASGIPGPESSTVRTTRPPEAVTPTSTDPAGSGVLAGVVHQDGDEAVDPLLVAPDPRRARGARAGREGDRAGLGDGPEAVRRGGYRLRHVDSARPVPGRGCGRRPGPTTAGRRRWRAAGGSRSRCARESTGTRPGIADRPSARSTSASITLSGVRSSWLASAVNSAWRRRICSIGADARRPDDEGPDEGHHQEQRARVPARRPTGRPARRGRGPRSRRPPASRPATAPRRSGS